MDKKGFCCFRFFSIRVNPCVSVVQRVSFSVEKNAEKPGLPGQPVRRAQGALQYTANAFFQGCFMKNKWSSGLSGRVSGKKSTISGKNRILHYMGQVVTSGHKWSDDFSPCSRCFGSATLRGEILGFWSLVSCFWLWATPTKNYLCPSACIYGKRKYEVVFLGVPSCPSWMSILFLVSGSRSFSVISVTSVANGFSFCFHSCDLKCLRRFAGSCDS